jgi:hypothetical protein
MPKPLSPVPTDLDIGQAMEVKPIFEIAAKLGIDQRHLLPFGHDKAKVHLDVLKDMSLAWYHANHAWFGNDACLYEG